MMWDRMRKRHPRLCDALETFMLCATVLMLVMAIDLYILIRGLYG